MMRVVSPAPVLDVISKSPAVPRPGMAGGLSGEARPSLRPANDRSGAPAMKARSWTRLALIPGLEGDEQRGGVVLLAVDEAGRSRPDVLTAGSLRRLLDPPTTLSVR